MADLSIDLEGEDPSSFAYIKVHLGKDGDGYYTLIHKNGEPGPRSEGYRGGTSEAALRKAVDAAHRDFPDLEIRVSTE